MSLPALRRIAAIHDLSGLGKCSLTVALPVISAAGVECACIPTALLSTHTGEFPGWTMHDLSDDMLPIAEHWAAEGVRLDGIYSGYLASPAQAALLGQILDLLAGPETQIIVDPVMADNGAYYSNLDEAMCRAFRRLIARAHVVTPNVTEAAFLTGMPYLHTHSPAYLDELLARLEALGARTVAVTGVRPEDGTVGNLAVDFRTGQCCRAMRPARSGLFYGAGDLFASALSALLVRGAALEDALETASSLVTDSVERTLLRGTPRRFGMDFEGALPAFAQRAAALFDEA